MAQSNLHQIAKSRKIGYEKELKEGVFWIAILYPECAGKPVSPTSDNADFLWLRVPAKCPVSKLLEVYQNKFEESIHLCFNGSHMPPTATVDQYNAYRDSLVVLQA